MFSFTESLTYSFQKIGLKKERLTNENNERIQQGSHIFSCAHKSPPLLCNPSGLVALKFLYPWVKVQSKISRPLIFFQELSEATANDKIGWSETMSMASKDNSQDEISEDSPPPTKTPSTPGGRTTTQRYFYFEPSFSSLISVTQRVQRMTQVQKPWIIHYMYHNITFWQLHPLNQWKNSFK